VRDVLVTGGAGFIGSHLVDHLLDTGCRVSVLASGNPDRLTPKLNAGRIRLITGSVLDSGLVEKEIQRVDTVFHLAAIVGVRQTLASQLESIRVSLTGTDNVLHACASGGKRAVIASSAEVYGKQPLIPWTEDTDFVLGSSPRWSYAAVKIVNEHVAMAYAAQGTPVSVVRYFNCYGPRQLSGTSVVAQFMKKAVDGSEMYLFGSGEQTRSFTYVSDTVRGTVLAAGSEAKGKIFNIGSDEEVSIAALAGKIASMAEYHIHIKHIPHEDIFGDNFEDADRRVPDISRARKILNWEPEVSLEDGLKQTLAWWRRDRRA
jgi:UDP-glucose 4-epimerase